MEADLSQLKVIELGSFISAAYCTKLMADLGAEVIKVEEPGVGDEARSYGPFLRDVPHPERSGLFLYLNSNKLGITLNPRTDEGKKLFGELVQQSDILVENNSPKLMQEYGLTYDTLSQVNPQLIMTSITPFGQTGAYRDHKACAINCSAAGGESNTIGSPGREPLAPPLSMGHYQSGGIAAAATMLAILVRDKDGRGQHIDIAEAELWASVHTSLMAHNFVFEGTKRMRAGHRTPGFYPYTILPCQNGYVSLTAIQGSQWKRFLEIVGGGKVPDWYANEPKFADRWVNSLEYADELDRLLAPWLTSHSKEEIFTECQENRVPFTPVRSIDEVVNAADLKEREYFVEVEHPATGKLKYPGAPYKFHKMPWRIRRPAPLLGEHNEEVYHVRLGYTREELARFVKGKVI
jgi:crotonobetainyl-CoA:carnitine CoA-transferase CaiB-like acyl-CoA transferase